MKILPILTSILFILCFPSKVASQSISTDDYQRAVSFMYDNYNNKTAFNLHTSVNWFEDNSGIWFLDHSESGKKYQSVLYNDFKVQSLFDHQKLTEELNERLEEKVEASSLKLEDLKKDSLNNLTFSIKGKSFIFNTKTSSLKSFEEKQTKKNNPLESKSPDGKWVAFTKDHNLFLKSTETQEEFQLSFDGKKNYDYGSYYGWFDKMEGESDNRPKRFWVNWSEDSQWLSTSICDVRNANKMYMLDWSIDSLYRPKLWSYYRGSPGDTNMVYLKPVFFNIKTKKEVETSIPRNTHINSVSIDWSKESGVAYANYAERGYQKEYVLKIDLKNNITTPLVTETSNTNIDNFRYYLLEEKGKIIFLSERSGWRQLYSVDLKTQITKSLTTGEYFINDVEHIDKEKGIIYFSASGKDQTMNPYHQQLYSTNLERDVSLLTPEKAHHSILFSKDGSYFVDNYSSIQLPTKTVLRSSDKGKILTTLTQADVSQVIHKGWQPPQTFSLIGKDSKSKIHGALWLPTNFDPKKKYPIIDHTYTGPHTQVFPKTFDRIFSNQSLAELGFVVMMVDGLGSSGRSKYFHDHSYKNMGDNLQDHVLAIQYLGKKFEWIDIDRVGIFGHSAGGFDTGHGMLAFPEVYKVGVASSADHDFRMEKAWWPEMYMGWPVDSSYHEVSNITMAKNLKGKLLLVHGAMDDNVNASATFKLAEALVKADKDFDLLIFPSQRHGYQGNHRKYFIKKRWNYFVEHLREEKPIWDFNWE